AGGGANERPAFPAQHPSASGRLEAPLRCERALSAGYHEECRMESRRLSRRWAEPLWRLSHASQSSWSRAVFPSLCRCRDRRLVRPSPDRREPGADALVASRSLQLLRSGSSAVHGTAAGSMSPVGHDGLAKLPDSDIEAVAPYFADINRSATRAGGSKESIISKAISTSGLGISQEPDPDARLYVAACGSCHYNSGAPLEVRPELALNTALTSPEPTNFIRVVLDGIGI